MRNEYGVECKEWSSMQPGVHIDFLGYVPGMISDDDPRGAKEQIQENYPFGGWQPFNGFSLDPVTMEIKYPSDPPLKPLFKRQLRDELILLYKYAWIAVISPDGSFEVSRID